MVSSSIFRVLCTIALAASAFMVSSTPARAETVDAPSPTTRLALGLEALTSDDDGRVTLRFTLPRAGIVRITLSTPDGAEVGTLASGLANAGENRLDIDVRSIPPGQYRCTLQTRDGNVTTRLIVVGR